MVSMKWVLLLTICLFLCQCVTTAESASSPPDAYMVQPNCQSRCGDVVIPYPFGIGKSCYMSEWYSVNCSDAERAYLNHTKLNLELLNVSVKLQSVTVNSPVNSFIGRRRRRRGRGRHGVIIRNSAVPKSVDLDGSPFQLSRITNKFVVLGSGHAELIYRGEILTGCTAINGNSRNTNDVRGGCYGIGCCQTTLPFTGDYYYLDQYSVSLRFTPTDDEGNDTVGGSNYAFLVDGESFSRNFSAVREDVEGGMKSAPLSLFWISTYDCQYYTSYVYSCDCPPRYEGNPNLPNGCHVVKECANCDGTCDYNTTFDDQSYNYEYQCNRKDMSRPVILGLSIGGGSFLLILGSIGLYKVVKKKREIRLKKKFFKRNGGLLLEQQISSNKVILEKTRIFTSEELEKATNNFNVNRVLGKGGQGTVYKGMLIDGRTVAIKKSMIIDESQIEHFINEIVILSQINHRNIVGLLGCCLETEVPLLVYEFISNGNLFQLIHNQDIDFPFSWKMRLQVATEVAGVLAYLHSACSIPIYHRDIKSTNILLDEKYKAKVSDFGTSRSIAIEQTHLTTIVKGTFGYLDPEYFQSGQFTDKSDVYSFGVVLLELLTGQKPICSTISQEEKSLATHFILSLQESRLFDILDARVVKEGEKEEILALAFLAYRCLSLNGKKRPTMREVTMELENIEMSLPILKVEENDYTMTEMIGPLEGTSSSAASCLDRNEKSMSDDQPFLFNTF